MSNHDIRSAARPEPDQVLVDIADYVCNSEIDSDLAYETAHYCLMDTLACGFQALDFPACTKLLGPVVPGATLPGGARVPGTSYELEPVMGAFNIGAMIRWLDFNDTWLAAEWGHPSDNLGGILATADYLSRQARAAGKDPLTMHDVLTAMIKAHEIQGVIALENGFNRVGQFRQHAAQSYFVDEPHRERCRSCHSEIGEGWSDPPRLAGESVYQGTGKRPGCCQRSGAGSADGGTRGGGAGRGQRQSELALYRRWPGRHAADGSPWPLSFWNACRMGLRAAQ